MNKFIEVETYDELIECLGDWFYLETDTPFGFAYYEAKGMKRLPAYIECYSGHMQKSLRKKIWHMVIY